MKTITVIKRSPDGREQWRYAATLLEASGSRVQLEAAFNAPDTSLMGVAIRTGDRFLETYYTDRWFNVFEIHDRQDDHLKGWYCNIGRPAVWEDEQTLSYIDLALDLWVAPDGSQTVVDEPEFLALQLDAPTREAAHDALAELQARFAKTNAPGH
jgi:predicted RNA-binding protein associated with RNAse of E/G family